MELKIIEFKAVDIALQIHQSDSVKLEEKKFSLSFSDIYKIDNDRIFGIEFFAEIFHPNEFRLKIKYITWFEASEPINDEFKKSHFPIINAPAIAFPYLRSFVSTLTLNAGFKPVLLPSINFANKEKEKVKDNNI